MNRDPYRLLTPASAQVIDGVVRVGDRVRHWGQRYPDAYSLGTATVTGFTHEKVLLDHDTPGNAYDAPGGWDFDRTVRLDPDSVAEMHTLIDEARVASGLAPLHSTAA